MKHHEKKKQKIRKFIRDAITAAMVAVFMFSLCIVDGISWLSVIGVVIPCLWFGLLAWANDGEGDNADVFDR